MNSCICLKFSPCSKWCGKERNPAALPRWVVRSRRVTRKRTHGEKEREGGGGDGRRGFAQKGGIDVLFSFSILGLLDWSLGLISPVLTRTQRNGT